MKGLIHKNEVMGNRRFKINLLNYNMEHLLSHLSEPWLVMSNKGIDSKVYFLVSPHLDTAISHGVRTLGNIIPKREIVEEFEQKAKDIINSKDFSDEDRNEKLKENFDLFIYKVKSGVLK